MSRRGVVRNRVRRRGRRRSRIKGRWTKSRCGRKHRNRVVEKRRRLFENDGMRVRSAGITTMESFNHLVNAIIKRKVEKWNPNVLVRGRMIVLGKVIVTLADATRINNIGDMKCRVVRKIEREGLSMSVKEGGVCVRLEQ